MKHPFMKPATSATEQATLPNTMTSTTDAPSATEKDGLNNDLRLFRLRPYLRRTHGNRISINRNQHKKPSNDLERPKPSRPRLSAGDAMTPEYIVWLDHHEPQNENVWWSPEDLKTSITGPARVHTVGYIIKETDDWLAVAGQVTEDKYTSQPLVIIKSCIVLRKKIKQGTIQ
jgi:hypothetical protein